jgi:MFS transporter, CP family, cyanate transporter
VLVLVALNLRPAVASIGPVLPDITRDLGLSPLGASVLTTIPVFAFGIFGILAPWFTRRISVECSVFFLLLALTFGLLVRGSDSAVALFGGQSLACVAIGVANVLLPGLMKRDFPDRLPLVTGLYTMGLCGGAALAAGLTVPLAHTLSGGWAAGLAAWSIPAALAAALWAGRLRHRQVAKTGQSPKPRLKLWTDPLAWQVTLFMGFQSSLAFIVFGWFAPMLRDRGMPPDEAGYALSVSVIVQAAAALVAPLVASRGRNQRLACVVAVLLCAVSLLGCVFAPLGTVWFWAVLLGIAQGSLFAFALMLIVLRAPNASAAGALSSMAQGVGYSIAAAGPFFSGLIRGWTGSWTAVALLWMAIAAGAVVAALGAGRSLHVGEVGK